MLYAVIAAIAALLGACCGLGGGVIIKPTLDAFTELSASQISTLSTFCVLTISLTSVIKYSLQKTKIDYKRSIFLGIGSSLGGIAGTWLFSIIVKNTADSLTTFVQSVLLVLLLALALLYVGIFKIRISFNLTNSVIIVLTGFLLGGCAAFIGIGGGPINVAMAILLFSLTVKEAAVCSLVIILISQLSKAAVLFFNGTAITDIQSVGVAPFLIMLGVAFCGAILGAYMNKRLPEKAVQTIYSISVCAIIAITLFNAVTAF